ncbi:murein biosynthesis integral membrane protein MurJ [candidate division TA06 bacterium]|nr:murein biosynthesis integral membrane protein MurJ [candidate division TA06 bacterium]
MIKSVGAFGLGTAISRIFGLGREVVLASLFGAGFAMDAFRVAFLIPNFLRDFFAEGTINAAFIPVFAETQKSRGVNESRESKSPRNRRVETQDSIVSTDSITEEGFQLVNWILNGLLVLVGGITLLGVLFSPLLVQGVAHGFSHVPEKIELTIRMTRIMFPYLLFVTLIAVVMGVLNFAGRFFFPAFSPTFWNLTIILSGFLIAPWVDPPILGIAIGVTLGGFLQLFSMLPSLYKKGFRYRPSWNLSHPAVKKVLFLALPVALGFAATKINLFVNILLATFLEEGSVSYLSYAFRLMHLPLGVFGVAVATVALPLLSREAAKDQMGKVRETFSHSFRLVLFLSLPASIFLFVLATPLIRLLFERGSFSPIDTLNTSQALQFYAIGIIGAASAKVVANTFYSLKDPKTPLRITWITVFANLLLCLILMRLLQFKGLALATSLAALLNLSLLLIGLRKKLKRIDGRRIFRTSSKVALSALLMGMGVFLFVQWFEARWITPSLALQIVEIFFSLLLATSLFFLLAFWMKVEEVMIFLSSMKNAK